MILISLFQLNLRKIFLLAVLVLLLRSLACASVRPGCPSSTRARGIAILLVVLYHAGERSSSGLAPLDALFWYGWTGVDLFFALSGFLITGGLLDALGSRGYYRDFYIRRALRIWPLYYAVLVAVFVVAPAVAPAACSSAEYRRAAGVQGWLWLGSPQVPTSVTGEATLRAGWADLVHLWSLGVEEHFYLIWPIVVGWLAHADYIAPAWSRS